MSKIGEAIIDLKTNLANFSAGLNDAKGKLSSFGENLRGQASSFNSATLALGGFIAGMVLLGTKATKEAVDFQTSLL